MNGQWHYDQKRDKNEVEAKPPRESQHGYVLAQNREFTPGQACKVIRLLRRLESKFVLAFGGQFLYPLKS